MSNEVPVEQAEPMGKYVPGCLGFPDTEEMSACQACSIRSQCLGFDRRVREEMVRVYGAKDPRREWKRETNKNRQRRYRERQKDADWQGLVDENEQKSGDGENPGTSLK